MKPETLTRLMNHVGPREIRRQDRDERRAARRLRHAQKMVGAVESCADLARKAAKLPRRWRNLLLSNAGMR
jgi:hypothetical protein